MIVPDFQNIFKNLSYLNREQQIRQFRMILDMLQEQISDNNKRHMQMSLHGLLYSILSETSYGETVFMAADILSSQILAVYLEQLRPDNILVSTELDETMDYRSDNFSKILEDYLDMLQQEMPNQFTIMIFSYRMLEGNFENRLQGINQVLAYRGRIILYDCPYRIPVTESFYLMTDHNIGNGQTIKVLQTKKELVKSDNYISVAVKVNKLLQGIIDIIESNETNNMVDQLIYEAWALDKELGSCLDDIPNKNLKFNINEIKNALLELRY